MKRPFKPHLHVTASPARVKLAVTGLLGGMLVAGLGCTGVIGTAARAERRVEPARDGPGRLGRRRAPVPGGSARRPGTGSGTGGQGGDPYAIPTSPPAAVLVATPRVARLSRQQWSNAVRDLLKLTDISDIDSNVSGDALIGFDDEADALFVTEQLRSQLFDASEKLADKVTGRRDGAGAPGSGECAHGHGRPRQGFHHVVRAARVPAAADDAEVTTHVGLFNQGADRSIPASTLSRRAPAW